MEAEAFYRRSETAPFTFLLLRFLAAGDPQPYREAQSNLACLLARNGGATRRPHREALCLGVVQQVLPVCTTMVIRLRRVPTGTLSAGT